MQPEQLTCDYLVVGAGAASLSFVDTILTEIPSSKIILVDKHQVPGGHWVDAYDFVRLHQPSLLYGVASRQLEGNWMKSILAKFTLPWNHRATKQEILAYFKDILEEWKSKGQVSYYSSCEYEFEKKEEGAHFFSKLNGTQTYSVKVKVKLVNGVLGEPRVPSVCKVEFPVDEDVNLLTPNELYQEYMLTKNKDRQGKEKKYIVLGCGKTGMDTVVFLQRMMGVKPDHITWVIPNDVWMLRRKKGNPWAYGQALLKHNGDRDKACEYLEDRGVFVRLDQDVLPARFRFPVIGDDELQMLRGVKELIRRGRVTSIAVDNEENAIKVDFGPEHDTMTFNSPDDHVFIHCTSPGPFNGVDTDELFVSDKEMNLALLYAPPVSISMSCLAMLEAARRNGTLDLEFGRRLLADMDSNGDSVSLTDNDVLKALVRGYQLDVNKGVSSQLRPLINLATFLAVLNSDTTCTVAHEWMKGNRLSFLSVPGFKCQIYENMNTMVEKQKELGLSDDEVRKLSLLRDRLQPLEGK